MYCKYSDGSTVQLVQARYDRTDPQVLTSYHVPLTDQNVAVPLGLDWQTWTISGVITDSMSVRWRDIVSLSLDNISWRTCRYQTIGFPSNMYQQSLYELTMLVSPILEGVIVRYPSSGYKWGSQSITGISQAGNASAYPTIHFLAPLFYCPLSNTLVDFTGQAVTFTRSAAKTHATVIYAINAPIFDGGLYLASDTSQDVALWTPPASTVRSVAMQIVRTRTSGAGSALTIWSSAHNTLAFDTSANVLTWTDGTTTVTIVFPTASWTAGTVLDVVVLHDAANAVTLAVHPASGSWVVGTGTLALLTWPQLTLGNLEGSINNLVEYPYVLSSAEYQALTYSSLSLLFNTLFIGNRYTGEFIKGSDKRLLNANGVDISALLGGTDIPIGASAVTIAQTQGMSARWYVELKRTDV